MKVINVHERELNNSPAGVGFLIDSLASDNDLLWPRQAWPRMNLDRPLSVGATGGHGPIRYLVEAYTPGGSIRFRFIAPKGFDGFHCYEVIPAGDKTILRHTLEMQVHGAAVVTWPVVFRPMHDALIEDSLASAEALLGFPPAIRPWSPWVRLLRWILSGGKAFEQVIPKKGKQLK
jgi:hypothetical protein